MFKKPIIRIIVYSIGLLVCVGILLFSFIPRDPWVHEDTKFTDSVGTNHENDDMCLLNFDAQIKDIEIDWVCGSITLQMGSGNDIVVMEYCNETIKDPIAYKVSGQTLEIRYNKDMDHFISFGTTITQEKHLVITFPEGWTGQVIEIDTASANVTMDKINVAELDFDGASGTCVMTECMIDKIDLDTASGDISFTGALEILDCDAASANCTVEVWNVPKSIDMDAASGNLDLILPEGAGFTCDMDTLSGSFHTDFECTDHEHTHTHGDGACKIKVNAMSGDVTIYKGSAHHQENHHN